MSGLSLRNRATVVAAAAAVVLPLSVMGAGSAAAADSPIDGLPVGGLTQGLSTDDLLGGDVLGGVLGTVGSLTGGTGLPVDPMGTAGAAAADPTGALGGAGTEAITQPLGSLVDLDILKTVTDVVDLKEILETVKDVVNIEDVLSDIGLDLDLEKLLNLPIRLLSPNSEVKGDSRDGKDGKDGKDDDRNSTVRAGALPKTGGNADLTALLLCAGLAVAGTGVTLVTRRRGGLGLGAA